MKKFLYFTIIFSLIFYILSYPKEAFDAASLGLLLWYQHLLPSLLPFAILSSIIVASGCLKKLPSILYPLFGGFLFGFPMGSKITVELIESGDLSKQQGKHIFSVCNNMGPSFINGYLLLTVLNRSDLRIPVFLCLYLPPIVYFILDFILSPRQHTFSIKTALDKKNTAPRFQINFKIIDAGIMNGFETLTKLGGYIMLFSIISQMVSCIPCPNQTIQCLLIGMIEVTNGLSHLSTSPLDFSAKFMLTILCTAFGGLSGFAQTASIIKPAGLSMKTYLKTKVLCTLSSCFLAWMMLQKFL